VEDVREKLDAAQLDLLDTRTAHRELLIRYTETNERMEHALKTAQEKRRVALLACSLAGLMLAAHVGGAFMPTQP